MYVGGSQSPSLNASGGAGETVGNGERQRGDGGSGGREAVGGDSGRSLVRATMGKRSVSKNRVQMSMGDPGTLGSGALKT